MSGDWIKVETKLPSKREVVAIADELGLDRYAVVGRLIELWAWFDANTVDGFCHAVSVTYVDDLCRQNGFANALIRVGWLEVSNDPKGVLMPKFERHNGKSSKNRILNAERQSRHRVSSNDSAVTEVTQGPLPKALPEKRREEEEQKQEISTSNDVDGKTAVLPRNACPVEKIVGLYHEILPELPACRKITPGRRGCIQQRWREDLTDLTDWRYFFENDVRASEFLMGKAQPMNGHVPFRADLGWLVNPTNFAKIIEGKYRGKVRR